MVDLLFFSAFAVPFLLLAVRLVFEPFSTDRYVDILGRRLDILAFWAFLFSLLRVLLDSWATADGAKRHAGRV